PALNQRTSEGFEAWLIQMNENLAREHRQHPGAVQAPWAVNLVVHRTNPRWQTDLALCVKHRVPIVITSLGAASQVVDAVHGYGGLVFHDVTTLKHARKAAEAGLDGIIAVAAGAGGHAGTLNPFVLAHEIRSVFDGTLLLAGGLSHGEDILAAQALGADLVYMGTRFIAASESMAQDAYRHMLVDAKMDDVLLTRAFTGLDANMLIPSIQAAGLDPDNLPVREHGSVEVTTDLNPDMQHKKRWKDIWSAGHGVGGIQTVSSAKTIIDQLKAEYTSAVQG
ncbi:MAG TPA: 2-nitropropane dioxygenase, partial [Porticoccaceae bacterium]|nr:2-nitropropane dioxygenase [Porticoccaceae bacterium]